LGGGAIFPNPNFGISWGDWEQLELEKNGIKRKILKKKDNRC